MKAHPYADLFPLMADDELRRLADDIAANGQREDISTLNDTVLDGRNRLRACEAAGVEPRFKEYKGKDPLGFVLSKNLHRRHLTESQRAVVAAELANMTHGGDRKADQEANLPLDIPQVSQAKAAELLNVGQRTVKDAKRVIKQGVPELVDAVKKGEVSASAAAKVATLPKKDQKKAVKAGTVKETAAEQRKAKAKPAATLPAQPVNQPAGGPVVDSEQADTPAVKLPKPKPVPHVDAWGIPIQPHAAEAFAAVPKFGELLALLKRVRGELTELCESPGGVLLLKRCQFHRSDNKAGGRWVLAELDNTIGVIEDATPRHTDCPYQFNTYQKHEAGDGRPCPLCFNRRFTGDLKRRQVPPEMLAAMREHYGVTDPKEVV